MTAIALQDFEENVITEVRVTPIWLRPIAISFVVAAHVAVSLAFVLRSPEPVTTLDAVEVAIVQQGAIETEAAAAPISDSVPDDLVAAEEQTPLSTPAAPQPPPELPAAEIPLKEVEVTDVLPVALPDPPHMTVKRLETTSSEIIQPKPEVNTPASALKPLKPQQDHKRVEKHRAPPSVERAAVVRTGASTAQRAGVEGGQDGFSGKSRAGYGALVLAELNRHQFYPASARAEGNTGSVGVAFTVGASGRIISHSITRSSGNSALDAAAHQMMQEVHVPPPQGGSFSGSTSIKFNIVQ